MDKSNRQMLSSKESKRNVYVVALISLITTMPTLLFFKTEKINSPNAESNMKSCTNHDHSLALALFRTLRFVCFYLIPVSIIFFSYCHVYNKLRRHIKTRSKNTINPIVERERKAQKLITALGFVFTVTWGSYHASKLYVNWRRIINENKMENRNAFRKKRLDRKVRK